MDFRDIAESKELYIASSIAIIIVAIIISLYFIKCYRHAVKCGISKDVLKKVIKSSVLFSIIPSLAIVAGLATLVAVIGFPYAWLRLSVLGSLAYEIMSSSMALNVMGVDLAHAGADAFGLVMWAMCLGITLPLVFNCFLCKYVHLGTMKIGAGDPKWSQLSQTTFMSALIIALIIPMIVGNLVSCLTFAASAGIALLLGYLAKKLNAGWLQGFVLAGSLFGAMAVSVILDGVLK